MKTLFEEFSQRFFEDGRVCVEALRVLDGLEEGFRGCWEYVDKSEGLMRKWFQSLEEDSVDRGWDEEGDGWIVDGEDNAEDDGTSGDEESSGLQKED